MNSLIFPVYLIGKDTFTALPEHQELFCFSLHHYFPNLRYSPHIYMLTNNLLDTLDQPSLSLLDSLSLMASLLLCPVNTSFLDLSRPSTLSPLLREYTRALLQFPLLEPWLENSLKLVSWAIVELTFFVSYLPFLHCLLSSVLKTSLIFFFSVLLFCIIIAVSGRINLVPVTPFWSKEEFSGHDWREKTKEGIYLRIHKFNILKFGSFNISWGKIVNFLIFFLYSTYKRLWLFPEIGLLKEGSTYEALTIFPVHHRLND